MKTSDIISSQETVSYLANEPLPFSVAVKLRSIITCLDPIYKTFIDRRAKLFEKYGEDKKDGSKEILDKHKEAFSKELEEILNTDIDVSFEKIPASQLKDCKISAAQLTSLEWLVDFDG